MWVLVSIKMSFYLIGEPQTVISIGKNSVNFVKVVQINPFESVILVVTFDGRIIFYDMTSRESIHQAELYSQKQKIIFIAKVELNQCTLCFLSQTCCYLLSLGEAKQCIKTQEKTINLKKLTCIQSQGSQILKYELLYNKQIRVLRKDKKKYVKIAGRTKSEIVYYFGVLSQEQGVVKVCSIFINTFPFEFKSSLNSLDSSLLIYQTYSNKQRPIKLTKIECLLDEKDEQLDQDRFDVSINHFSDELTVIQVFQLNQAAVCLFGSNHSHDKSKTTLMIVYNIKQLFTLNYFQLDGLCFDRIHAFLIPNYVFSYDKDSIGIDAFATQDKQTSHCFLYPACFKTQVDKYVPGCPLSVDRGYVIYKDDQNLTVHPKICKQTIYSYFLNHLKVNSSFASIVTSLLD